MLTTGNRIESPMKVLLWSLTHFVVADAAVVRSQTNCEFAVVSQHCIILVLVDSGKELFQEMIVLEDIWLHVFVTAAEDHRWRNCFEHGIK